MKIQREREPLGALSPHVSQVCLRDTWFNWRAWYTQEVPRNPTDPLGKVIWIPGAIISCYHLS